MIALMRVACCAVPALLFGLVTCGGRTTSTEAPEASVDIPPTDTPVPEREPPPPQRTDGSIESPESSRPPPALPPPPDEKPRDAGQKTKYTLVDGGRACQGFRGVSSDERLTCCNGVLCKGQCLLAEGAKTPVCLCAGFEGGCPSDWLCCLGMSCEPRCSHGYR